MQQNCKKGLCLAFLFSAMFLTGWEIAGMRSRQTKETAAVAYEAGNWGNPAHRQCNLCGVGAVRCTLCRGSVREGALSDLRLRIGKCLIVICEKNLRNQILFLMVEKGVAVMSRTYYSKKKCGVDTADFYHQFGMSVRTVAEETGISRQVLTGFLINQITMPMVCRILEYLEDKTVEDYERTVERCSCRMKDVEEKRKTAWGDYLFREKNIAGLRKMYLLKRSQPLVPQKSGKEICSVL